MTKTKPWKIKSKLDSYKLNSRNLNRTFLIVCEGQTEEQYFKSFPIVSAKVQFVHAGSSKTSLVKATQKLRRGISYDETWCVFDFDKNPLISGQNEDFNRAIEMARQLGYRCAYSNDAFELWLALHYQYIDQEQHRSFYYTLLSKRWGIAYNLEGKALPFARGIYTKLQEDQLADQQQASRHNEKLWIEHKEKPYHRQNPVTTVFQLVEQLNKYCRK